MAKQDWLRKILTLPAGVPSHDTIGRVLATLKPSASQACFAQWTASIQGVHVSQDAREFKHIAIDGKVLRRSHDQRQQLGPLFLFSASSVECGVSLGQLAIAEKSSEITAIPALLENLEVKGAIVTIDAAGCQKNIARQIVDGGVTTFCRSRGIKETSTRRSKPISSSRWRTTSPKSRSSSLK